MAGGNRNKRVQIARKTVQRKIEQVRNNQSPAHNSSDPKLKKEWRIQTNTAHGGA